MKYSFYTLIIVSLNLFLGCTNIKLKDKEKKEAIHEHITQEMNKKYIEAKSFFDDKFVEHFPEELNSNVLSTSESISPEAELIELMVTNKVSKEEYKNLIKKNEKIAIAAYNCSDTCLLIINRFANKQNYSYNITLSKQDSALINLDCYQNLYPIPNFWHNDFLTEETNCRLPNDFRIFVIDAKPGKFLEDQYLTDGKYMPSDWKNGFSKGVAISEKRNVVIYWLVIW